MNMEVFGLTKEEWRECFSIKSFINTLKNPRFYSGNSGIILWVAILFFLATLKNVIVGEGLMSVSFTNFIHGMIVGLFCYWFI